MAAPPSMSLHLPPRGWVSARGESALLLPSLATLEISFSPAPCCSPGTSVAWSGESLARSRHNVTKIAVCVDHEVTVPAKLMLGTGSIEHGFATLSHKTRLSQAGLIVVLTILFLLVGNAVLGSGVVGALWGIPASAVFVGNYDDAEKELRWDAFIAKYPFLDPKPAGVSGGSVSITLPNAQNELLYGNNVVILEPTISSKSVSAL